jgi:hypothetical protein
MKKSIILLFLAITFACQAQNLFKGFLQPLKPVEMPKTLKSSLTTTVNNFVLRPFVGVTANAIKIGGGNTSSQDLSCLAVGVTYTNVLNNYGQYGVTALIMTNIDFGGVKSLQQVGAGITGTAFNGLVNIGVSYIGKNFYVLYGINIKEILNL